MAGCRSRWKELASEVARRCAGVVTVAVLIASCLAPNAAAEIAQEELARLFPQLKGQLTLGPTSGSPPAAEVRQSGKLVGYVFSTATVTRSVGFSGKPFDVLVGLAIDGTVAGARLVSHEEPILVIGVSPGGLDALVIGLRGTDIKAPIRPLASRRSGAPDHVAGATISSIVIREAVLRAARIVALSRGILGRSPSIAEVNRAQFATRAFAELLAEGGIARGVFKRSEFAPVAAQSDRPAEEVVLELHMALLTPPTIGQNLLGRREFERLEAKLAADQHAVLIAASGLYSLKGALWRQTGSFDRFQIVQGATTIRFSAEDHDNVERLAAAGAPEAREIGIFRIPLAARFDPGKPFRLELATGGDDRRAPDRSTIAVLEYRLPPKFLRAAVEPPPSPPPRAATETELWQEIWWSRQVEIALTAALLLSLGVILFSHDLLVRDVRRYAIVRISFLFATVIFLGLYAGAQLSVVHVVTFVHALLGGFSWEQFLLDPLVFILWSFVALALIFWGRGVFCGWLCPFGALQEILNQAARRLGVRQIEIPWPLHERLWPMKYVAFLLILGLSLKSARDAFVLAEIEPFKTVITLKLMRAWPFLLYAAAVLAAGLFIERFFCRYLCPLGAALAMPARLRLFEWLKRRPQCGRECRICAARCTVQAINPLGQIQPNECIYCLKCQANYYDATTCLPLIQRAQRRQATNGQVALTTGPKERDYE
ncbi:MAG: 4Fe-4S binding protein [Hyphomicrobiaceae bacterium]|nr:MAG: 4Fe-4S binding protein [Hyphomicrobiaceae bacterium]